MAQVYSKEDALRQIADACTTEEDSGLAAIEVGDEVVGTVNLDTGAVSVV